MPPRIAPLAPPYSSSIDEKLAQMMPPGIPPLILFRTLARNERILDKIRLGNLLDRGSIERRDREIVILRTCARCRSEYEWGVHVFAFAERYGLTEAQVAATTSEDPTLEERAGWSAKDRATLRVVDELHQTSTISGALWCDLERHYTGEQIIELIVLTGFYHTISFVTNGLEIELEADAARFPTGV